MASDTLELKSRLWTAMLSNGIFTPEQLASESGVSLHVIQDVLNSKLDTLDAVSSINLRRVLGSYSLKWLILGEGGPSSNYRLTDREAWVVDHYRQMTEAGQDRVDNSVRRYTPK